MPEKLDNIFKNQPETGESLEEKIERKLKELPNSPKRQELEEKYENCDTEELPNILDSINVILKKINSIRQEKTEVFEIHKTGKELISNNETAIKVIIDEIKKRNDLSIGKGGTAEVFESINFPERYCYKIVYNFNEYKYHNDIDNEGRITDSAYYLNNENGRVPKPLYYIKGANYHVLVMEKIKGKDLEQALIDKTLPDNFDINIFLENFRKFLEHLHENGIHHRDVRLPNIMIDWDNPNIPVLIDFGKAIENVLRSENPYFKRDETSKIAKHWLNDLRELEEIQKNKSLINLYKKRK